MVPAHGGENTTAPGDHRQWSPEGLKMATLGTKTHPPIRKRLAFLVPSAQAKDENTLHGEGKDQVCKDVETISKFLQGE